MSDAKDHYKGDSGKAYFQDKFDGRLTLGRQFQAGYFSPFCSEDKVIVDFGCGDGTILRSLQGKRKFGVELNPACHQKIEDYNAEQSVPIEIHTSLDQIDDGIADVVISNHCMEHVPSPLEQLQHIYRVLSVGGTLVLLVPFDDWRMRKNSRWVAGDPDMHLFTWCPLSLGNLVSTAGLKVQESRVSSMAWTPKIFFVHRLLGAKAFRFACFLNAAWTKRREVICIAKKI